MIQRQKTQGTMVSWLVDV